MPARVLGAKRHMNVHRDWCRGWLAAMSYTRTVSLPCRHTHSHSHTCAQKGAERQRQRKACRDDLGFSHSSATVLLLNGGSADFDMQACIQAHQTHL